MATFPNGYDLIVTYQNQTDPTIQWRNTFTFISNTVPVFGAGIVGALGGFAQTLCHPDSSVVEYKCYNWARGRQPYPLGLPLFVHTLNIPGTAPSHWTALSASYVPTGGEVVLRIDHVPTALGRPGRTFVRGLLGENDISALSGGRIFLTGSLATFQADLNTIVSSSGLGAFLVPTATTQVLAVIQYTKKTDTVHGYAGIGSLVVIDATNNKRSRKNKH